MREFLLQTIKNCERLHNLWLTHASKKIYKMCIRDRENSRPVDFDDDRLRERGSLPATFYVLKGYFLW